MREKLMSCGSTDGLTQNKVSINKRKANKLQDTRQRRVEVGREKANKLGADDI